MVQANQNIRGLVHGPYTRRSKDSDAGDRGGPQRRPVPPGLGVKARSKTGTLCSMIRLHLFPPALSDWLLTFVYYERETHKGNGEAGVPNAEQNRSIRGGSRKAGLEEPF